MDVCTDLRQKLNCKAALYCNWLRGPVPQPCNQTLAKLWIRHQSPYSFNSSPSPPFDFDFFPPENETSVYVEICEHLSSNEYVVVIM